MCWSEGVRLQLSVLSSLRLKLHSDYLATALQGRARTKWLGLHVIPIAGAAFLTLNRRHPRLTT